MLGDKILAALNTSEEKLVSLLDADVREIFGTMVGVEVTMIEEADTLTHFVDSVSAMVGFAGGYNGLISVNTPKYLALRFSGLMLGMEPDECEEDMADSLGEIANMIGGSFKHHFVKDGHEVRLSTPSVITGNDYQVSVGTMPDSLTLKFGSDGDVFTVSLYLELGD